MRATGYSRLGFEQQLLACRQSPTLGLDSSTAVTRMVYSKGKHATRTGSVVLATSSSNNSNR
jgi:hypothetical protein